MEEHRMMKWFDYNHLPQELQLISRHFFDLAYKIFDQTKPGPEQTVALRKLLESKDAVVRAAIHPGG